MEEKARPYSEKEIRDSFSNVTTIPTPKDELQQPLQKQGLGVSGRGKS